MLRIITQHQGGTTVLRLEGRLHGPWVGELRDCWQRVRQGGDETIRIELADVRLVDPAGKRLLTEIHRTGAEILAHGSFTVAIRDEIIPATMTSRTKIGE
jgi:ABC-type transporter Mla MlaB component